MSDCFVPLLYSLSSLRSMASKILMRVPFSDTVARRLPSWEMLTQLSAVLWALRTDCVHVILVLSTFTTSAVPALVPRHPKMARGPFPPRHPSPQGLGSVEMVMRFERLFSW